MIAVLPTLHTIYKISFEFFVSSADGNGWSNIIHLTKDNVQNGHSCNQRIRGLWTRKDGNRLKFYLSGCVNGAEKVIYPFANNNTWNSIEFGQVHLNIFFYISYSDNLVEISFFISIRMDGILFNISLTP